MKHFLYGLEVSSCSLQEYKSKHPSPAPSTGEPQSTQWTLNHPPQPVQEPSEVVKVPVLSHSFLLCVAYMHEYTEILIFAFPVLDL